jgi:iron complex transport system substrate-binding protein
VASAESILALSPTAVVGLAVVGEQDPELVATLRRRGIDVYLGRPRTLDDVYGVVRAVGGRAREPAGAERAVASAMARAAAVLGSAGSAGSAAPAAKSSGARRLFVYDCCDPPFTAGGQSVLSDLIARAGARNIFADLPAGWAHVSWEAVIARAPELIVIDDYAPEETGAAGAATNAGAALARKRAALAAIPSLARLPVVALPLGFALGGLGSLDALERLRAIAVGGAG